MLPSRGGSCLGLCWIISPGKDAGRRNESYDGLLFPPERGQYDSWLEWRKNFFYFF